jgi:hypothetical protein
MSTPSSTETRGDRRAPSTLSHFSRGVDVLTSRPWLALVPLVAGLLSVDQLERAAGADVTMQVNFGLPGPVAGVWTFLNAPTRSGVSLFGYSGSAVRAQPELLVRGVVVGGGSLLLVGLLTAVYLGAIDDVLAGRSGGAVANLRRHAPVTVAFAALQLLALVVLLAAGGGLLASGPGLGGAAALFLPLFLAAVAGYYLLVPGVYAGVAADLGPRRAFRRGVAVALTADYLVFALAYAVIVAACSVPLSAVAFTAGLPSILLVAAIGAPVGLALAAATMAFVHHHLDGVGGNDETHDGGGRDPTPAVRRVSDVDGGL